MHAIQTQSRITHTPTGMLDVERLSTGTPAFVNMSNTCLQISSVFLSCSVDYYLPVPSVSPSSTSIVSLPGELPRRNPA